jgi:hypothetical protein
MTDGDVVKIARKMARLQDELFDLLDKVEQSDHPNAAQLGEALREECIFLAWPTHVIHSNLERPDAWECATEGVRKNMGIKYKGVAKEAK